MFANIRKFILWLLNFKICLNDFLMENVLNLDVRTEIMFIIQKCYFGKFLFCSINIYTKGS